MDDMINLLGEPLTYWIRVRAVLQKFDIKDADDLAFKLRSRGWMRPEATQQEATHADGR